MPLIIEITEGIQKGEKFKVFDKATLGRKRTDMLVKDPNISSLHAKIVYDEAGQPVLVDQNSRNGLILNQQVVRKIPLLPDLEFTVGETHFCVKEISADELEVLFPTKTWKDFISEYINSHPPETYPSEEIKIFNPKVQLQFIQGIQTDEIVTIGYGPRNIGFYSLDVALYEGGSPDLAFKLIPSEEGAKILNCSINDVFLNDMKFETSVLISGDRIRVGKTIIKVIFVN